MKFEEITQILSFKFDEYTFGVINQKSNYPILQVPLNKLVEVCEYLNKDQRLYFDFLASITGIDNGLEIGTMEILYHLTSIPYEHSLTLQVQLQYTSNEELPEVPTISHIWRTADWHERETYDLLGISFSNHPDLRRILLPNDWQGFPLRKDYQEQEVYHGIKVKY